MRETFRKTEEGAVVGICTQTMYILLLHMEDGTFQNKQRSGNGKVNMLYCMG